MRASQSLAVGLLLPLVPRVHRALQHRTRPIWGAQSDSIQAIINRDCERYLPMTDPAFRSPE